MQRITPQEVAAAYAATGLKPHRRTWYARPMAEIDVGCACGIGVLIIHRFGNGPDITSRMGLHAGILVGNVEYLAGFIRGFDGDPDHSQNPGWESEYAEYRLGHEDGAAAAALVFAEELVAA